MNQKSLLIHTVEPTRDTFLEQQKLFTKLLSCLGCVSKNNSFLFSSFLKKVFSIAERFHLWCVWINVLCPFKLTSLTLEAIRLAVLEGTAPESQAAVWPRGTKHIPCPAETVSTLLVSQGPWEGNKGGCAQEAVFNLHPQERMQTFFLFFFVSHHIYLALCFPSLPFTPLLAVCSAHCNPVTSTECSSSAVHRFPVAPGDIRLGIQSEYRVWSLYIPVAYG